MISRTLVSPFKSINQSRVSRWVQNFAFSSAVQHTFRRQIPAPYTSLNRYKVHPSVRHSPESVVLAPASTSLLLTSSSLSFLLSSSREDVLDTDGVGDRPFNCSFSRSPTDVSRRRGVLPLGRRRPLSASGSAGRSAGGVSLPGSGGTPVPLGGPERIRWWMNRITSARSKCRWQMPHVWISPAGSGAGER